MMGFFDGVAIWGINCAESAFGRPGVSGVILKAVRTTVSTLISTLL